MLLTVLAIIASLVLALAALSRISLSGGRNPERTYHVLLPFALAAGILGSIPLCTLVFELFVGYYSGSMYEFDAMRWRIWYGPYRWFYCAAFSIPNLPFLCVIPFFGRRPWLVAATGILTAAGLVWRWFVGGE